MFLFVVFTFISSVFQFREYIIVYVHVLFVLGRKDGNYLFNDALKTFLIRLYGVGHMEKGHSGSEREKTRFPHFIGYN